VEDGNKLYIIMWGIDIDEIFEFGNLVDVFWIVMLCSVSGRTPTFWRTMLPPSSS
jgi:hypothetical protein